MHERHINLKKITQTLDDIIVSDVINEQIKRKQEAVDAACPSGTLQFQSPVVTKFLVLSLRITMPLVVCTLFSFIPEISWLLSALLPLFTTFITDFRKEKQWNSYRTTLFSVRLSIETLVPNKTEDEKTSLYLSVMASEPCTSFRSIFT